MDVTRENFEELLPEILDDIYSSSFISVDTELTGLWRKEEPRQLDTPEDYYIKFIANASKFLCIQFGLTTFKINSSTKRYSVKSYKFNLFPRPFSRNSSYTFSCQASSIDFLASHNFDFNKIFYKGISYLNIESEAKLSEMLKERRFYKEKNAGREMEIIDIPDDLKDSVDEACDKLGSVLDSDLSDDEVKVAGLSAFVRRLVYQTIKSRYANGELFVETREGVMISHKAKPEGEEQKTQLELDEEAIDRAVGFSKVIKALAKSGKLIIGHNMFLDLGHTVNHFMCELPETYGEFKALVRGTFPLLLDTKFMSSSKGMHSFISCTTLDRLYKRMSQEPFSLPDMDLVDDYSYDDEKLHDAGFDSYLTGVIFLSMYNFMATTKKSKGIPDFNPRSDALKKFLNRLYLNNTPDCHMYMSGDDPLPDRDHCFHVSFPKDWVTSDIVSLFNNHGRTHIHWINDSSAWVFLNNPDNADFCKSELCSKSAQLPRGVRVLPYSEAVYLVTMAPSRKRESSPTCTPQRKRHRSSRDSSFSSTSFIEASEENLDGKKIKKEQKRDLSFFRSSFSSTSFTEETQENLDEKKNKRGQKRRSEGNGVHRRKSHDSAISELEKEMDADSSLKSSFGNSDW